MRCIDVGTNTDMPFACCLERCQNKGSYLDECLIYDDWYKKNGGRDD